MHRFQPWRMSQSPGQSFPLPAVEASVERAPGWRTFGELGPSTRQSLDRKFSTEVGPSRPATTNRGRTIDQLVVTRSTSNGLVEVWEAALAAE